MHFRSLKSGFLRATYQHTLPFPSSAQFSNVRQVPLGQAAAVGVMNALPGDGDDALIGEEELLYGAIGGCMAAIRGIAFELWTIQRSHASL
jgi:hypothetical protein